VCEVRAAKPDVSKLLLNGFQAASFPISSKDFLGVMELLDEIAEWMITAIEENHVLFSHRSSISATLVLYSDTTLK
jgi:hypothetical protein